MSDFIKEQVTAQAMCPYCKDGIDTAQAIECAQCSTRAHQSCLNEHGGCLTFGCNLGRANTPSSGVPEGYVAAPSWAERVRELGSKRAAHMAINAELRAAADNQLFAAVGCAMGWLIYVLWATTLGGLQPDAVLWPSAFAVTGMMWTSCSHLKALSAIALHKNEADWN